MIEIGIDEAGRGPVIGPLVVCSVALPKDDVKLLIEAGVKDSKDLTPKKREEIRKWFLQNCEQRGWSYALIPCQPSRIDIAVYDKGLNRLETELFAESINELDLELNGIYIDMYGIYHTTPPKGLSIMNKEKYIRFN